MGKVTRRQKTKADTPFLGGSGVVMFRCNKAVPSSGDPELDILFQEQQEAVRRQFGMNAEVVKFLGKHKGE